MRWHLPLSGMSFVYSSLKPMARKVTGAASMTFFVEAIDFELYDRHMMKKNTFFGFVVLIGMITVGLMSSRKQDSAQPIAYNHYKHVEESGMGCLDCHLNAGENARASIPNIEVCRDCHDVALTESETELTLLDFINDGKKIPWRQVYFVPDYVYFSHRRHVKLGQLECTVCHGDVGQLTEPIAKPFVQPTMTWCMDCHNTNSVSNDCAACHR